MKRRKDINHCSIQESKDKLNEVDIQEIKIFRRRIMSWWNSNKQIYPWRNNPSIYESLIAETMLQKTPATRVNEVYENFIRRFPDIWALAAAETDEIKEYFFHLGLVKRVIWLKETATKIVKNFNGIVPRNVEILKSLPGVGEYTANAIAVFSMKQRLILMDVNFKRVYMRYFGEQFFKDKNFLSKIPPKRRYVDFYYAVLDFSSKICRAKKPLHDICILKSWCKSFKGNIP